MAKHCSTPNTEAPRPARISLGRWGEACAESFLLQQHLLWHVVARNWRVHGVGELDLVLYDASRQLLVLAEVKTRRNRQYGSAAEAVTPRKQQTILQLAEHFVAEHPEYSNCALRFDVVSVYAGSCSAPPDIIHLAGAFEGS